MSSKPDTRPVVVLVGGFLGAGKTTLLLRAAHELRREGIRSAIITNDQASDLVDTRLARNNGNVTREVTGGCFCCRFSDLVASARSLAQFRPEVIFAEPVGSCTDIVATTLRPLCSYFSSEFRVAPFTVLVHPDHERQLGADAAANYLFRKQLEEADLVCYTHSDLYDAGARRLSGKTGAGVRPWLDEVLAETALPRLSPLFIDYAEYAAAEASLGWVNWQARLELRRAETPANVLGRAIENIDTVLTARGIRIFHLKGFVDSPTGRVKAAITCNGAEPSVEGDVVARRSRSHRLLLNLRANGEPSELASVVEPLIDGTITLLRVEAFRPSAPTPEHRL